MHPGNTESDSYWMRHAMDQALRAWGNTHPNPMVGAVIVSAEGKLLGEGYHAKHGESHAEVNAFRSAVGKNLEGATIYVTLEPCCTHGRTPPCTDAIIRSGIKRVVVGAVDPNPEHAGKGFDVLKAAGVEVVSGVLENACSDLNLIFNHYITKRTPLLAAKVATTIDGRIATRLGESKWITGEASRADVMRWRRYFPAIAVGAGTVMADDPRLTSRQKGLKQWCPIRFVFDRAASTALVEPFRKIYSDEHTSKTIVVHRDEPTREARESLEHAGVQLWKISEDAAAFWTAFRQRCLDTGITGVYFEGGARILGELFRHRQMDYLFAYRAPLLFGDSEARPAFAGEPLEQLAHASRLVNVQHATFGDDSLMRGYLAYASHV